MNRGSLCDSCLRYQSRIGFNEAPIHESGKYTNRVSEATALAGASMRPRFMNRGSPAESDGHPVASIASMRPRFMNRGSASPSEGPFQSIGASMRPRFMNRGSDQIISTNYYGGKLQ